MLDYKCIGQMSIMDFLVPETDERKPELCKGKRIHRVVLDVIETGVIDHLWELKDCYGYSALRDGTRNRSFITFWSPDINNTVFTNILQAQKYADSKRNQYEVIRAEDVKVIEEKNFGNGEYIRNTVKMLDGYRVYFQIGGCYGFLELCSDENSTRKLFNEKVNEIINGYSKEQKIEMYESVPMKDMYKCKNGNWSEYGYAHHNGPVLRKEVALC